MPAIEVDYNGSQWEVRATGDGMEYNHLGSYNAKEEAVTQALRRAKDDRAGGGAAGRGSVGRVFVYGKYSRGYETRFTNDQWRNHTVEELVNTYFR